MDTKAKKEQASKQQETPDEVQGTISLSLYVGSGHMVHERMHIPVRLIKNQRWILFDLRARDVELGIVENKFLIEIHQFCLNYKTDINTCRLPATLSSFTLSRSTPCHTETIKKNRRFHACQLPYACIYMNHSQKLSPHITNTAQHRHPSSISRKLNPSPSTYIRPRNTLITHRQGLENSARQFVLVNCAPYHIH